MRVARIELVSFMVHSVAVEAMNTWDCPFQAWERTLKVCGWGQLLASLHSIVSQFVKNI